MRLFLLFVKIYDILFGYSIVRELKFLMEQDSMTSHQLIHLQKKKLDEIITFALGNSPFYHGKVVDNSTDPYERIKNFPVVSKEEVMANFDLFQASGVGRKRLVTLESSGSSGLKTTVNLTKKEHSICRAILIHWWIWTGYRFKGTLVQTGITPRRRLIKTIKDFISNTIYLNAFSLAESDMDRLLKRLEGRKNITLAGYPSSIYVLAEYAKKENYQICVSQVICWGDKLFSHYKSTIEKVFSTIVYENYACNEGIMIGQKVDLEYFYIQNSNVYIEIVDENGNEVEDGKTGQIVVTKLDGFAMPLLRYKTGDLGTKLPLKDYPTNRLYNYPLLKSVIGRNTDLIYDKKGRTLTVHSFTGIFEYYHEIKQFQIVQEKAGNILIRYIPSKSFEVSVINRIESDIYIKCEAEMEIEWISVSDIIPSKSGKPQLVLNLVNRMSLTEIIE